MALSKGFELAKLGSGLDVNQSTGEVVAISMDTDVVSEGTTNIYFTDARVDNRVASLLAGGTTGNIVTTGYIAGPATFTIDPAGVGDNTGTVVIAGNLQVDGTQTTINSTTLDVDDLNITVASGAADSAAANGAGLTVDGAGANITYTHATTSWDFNKDINVTGTTTTDQYLYVNSPNGTQLQLRSEDAYTTLAAGNRNLNISANRTIFLDDAFAEVMRINDDGNVGIGTAAPSHPLHVAGNIAFENGDGLISRNVAGSTRTLLTLDTTNRLRIKGNAPEAVDSEIGLTLIDNGNVGIGILAPATALHVRGTASTAGATRSVVTLTDDTAMGINVGSGVAFRGLYTSAGAEANYGGIFAGKSNANSGNANGYLSLSYSASGTLTEGIRISETGNVGIGTTTPARSLEVHNGSSSMIAQFRSSSGDDAFICFANNTSTADKVRLGSKGDDLVLSTNFTPRVTIANSGKVGIGDSTPTANGLTLFSSVTGATRINLHIGGSGTVPNSGSYNTISNNQHADILISSNAYINGNGNPVITSTHGNMGGTGIKISGAGGSHDIKFYTSNASSVRGTELTNTERMTISETGKVGIGTSTFGTNGKLQVAGGIGLTGNSEIRQSTNSDGSTLRFLGTQFVAGAANSHSYSYTDGALIAARASHANALLFDVGANSTSGHKLKVLNDGNGIAGSLQYLNGSDTRFIVKSSTGNVGIGTATPSTKLDISTSGDDGITLNADTVTATASSRLFFNNGTAGKAVGLFNSFNALRFAVLATPGTNTGTEKMRLTQAGFLSLGGHSPATVLDIANVGGAHGLALNADANNATLSSRLFLNNGTAGKAISIMNNGNDLSISTAATPGSGSGSEKVRILENGNVGIGTTSPSQKLDVAGNIALSGTVDGVDIAARDGVLTSTTTTANAALPKAGGTMTGDINFGDNDKASFGASNNLEIYYDGTLGRPFVYATSPLFIASTGNIWIGGDSIGLGNPGSSEYFVQCVNNGEVKLYHDNAEKLATTSTGIDVTGNANFANNGKAIFGASNNLQIFSTGTSSYVAESGSGDLYIKGSSIYLTDTDNNQYIHLSDTGTGGTVVLKHNAVSKLATTATGIDVTGNITVSGYIAGPAVLTIDPAGVGDNTGKVVIAGDLQIDGTTTTINSTTLTVDDLNITLASGAADSAAANGAGITVDGANATITYDGTNDEWDFNKDVNVTGNIALSGTVDGVDIAARDGVLTSTTTTANAALPKAGGAMTGAITTNSTFDGRNVSVDGDKLDLIEAGATADQTAAQLLAAIKTVDVNGSAGLNAGRLDGHALTTASTASTVVERNTSGDINARLFRSEYDTTNSSIGYIMTQVDTASNNYVRPSTPAQVRSALNVENGATADQTAAQILTAVKTVDGSGSGLDADTVDGIQASSFLRSDAADTMTGNLTLSGQLIGGVGAVTTSGTLDWNHSTNARSGNGHTLLLGSATNGPSGGSYYHPFSFEYNTKGGTGNMTQFAIPYNNAEGVYFRSRYSSVWTGWNEMWHSGNDGTGSGLDADLLDGVQGSSYFLKAGGTMTGNLDVTGTVMADDLVRISGVGTNTQAVADNLNLSGYGIAGNRGTVYFTNNNASGTIDIGVGGAHNANVQLVINSAGIAVTGAITATGDVTAYFSDPRLKDFHGTIPNAMDKVKQLNGYYFTENQLAKDLGYNNDSTQVGVSAQEVEAVLPEIVKEAAINTEKGTDYKTVQYEKLTALLIEAVKEQQTEIDELKKLVKDLMSR